MDGLLPPLVVCLNASADSVVRDALGRHLAPAQSARRLRYWHPGLLSPGADVERTTRQQLRETALVLPLLSADFYSDYQAQHMLSSLREIPAERIIPVLARSVAFDVASDGLSAKQTLPRDHQPLLSRPDADSAYVAIVQEILASLDRLGPRAGSSADSAGGTTPAPQAAGATFDPRWYVLRDREQRTVRRRMEGVGLPIVIQGPHLFGKTWLLEYLLTSVRGNAGLRLVELNLAGLSEDDRRNPGRLRHALGERVLASCNLPSEWLAAHIGPGRDEVTGFEGLLRQVLLAAPGPLYLTMDRADDLPAGPVRTGFYKQLRAFVDLGVRDPWSRLRLILCISTTPTELQPDPDASPFSGSEVILLDEFDDAQVERLLKCYGLNWTSGERLAVRELVGGHPYLLRLLMDEAAHNGAPVGELLHGDLEALDAYLVRLERLLRSQPELHQALRRVRDQPDAPLGLSEYWRLHRMGLVDRRVSAGTGRRQVRIRCSLYQRLLG